MSGVSFNSAGAPPPKGDPETVLKNYMQEHNCSEAEARAALEQMYGKPQPPMEGMTETGTIDFGYQPYNMPMPPMQSPMPGMTPYGTINFNYAYDNNFNPAGTPPPKGDPETVLKQYMQEHNCSEAEAKAELEKMYGKPQQPNAQMQPGYVLEDLSGQFGMFPQPMPIVVPYRPGVTPSGSIDFSSNKT